MAAEPSSASLKPTYQQSVNTVAQDLNVDVRVGLSDAEAERRLEQYGENAFSKKAKRSVLLLFLKQFLAPLEVILLVVIGISIYLGEYLDAAVVGVAVLFDVITGFVTELRAIKTVESLQSHNQPVATVRRDGLRRQVESIGLVPGDVVYLRSGDKVPADLRLVNVSNLQINESALTGESEAVSKELVDFSNEVVLGDRSNMAYVGTVVVAGSGEGVVVATGSNTAFGKIAETLVTTEDQLTPLQERLRKLAFWIGMGAIGAAVLLFLAGVLAGNDVVEMFEIAVTAVVSVVPEGLAAVITIVLAIGMRRILRRKAIVRQLVAAETLGSTSVICVDKTKTLTIGDMTMERVMTMTENIEGIATWMHGNSDAAFDREIRDAGVDMDLLLRTAVLNSEAELENPDDDESEWRIYGGSTESAIVGFAGKVGVLARDLRTEYSQVFTLPFHYKRKFSLTVDLHEPSSQILVSMKGAPEVVLPSCTSVQVDDGVSELSADGRARILNEVEEFSKKGYRILAFAYKRDNRKKAFLDIARQHGGRLEEDDVFSGASEKQLVQGDLVFLGLVGIVDPLRPDIQLTLDRCQNAGIQVAMLTGDYQLTAESIARSIGLFKDGDGVIHGDQMHSLSADELASRVRNTQVFARVTPFDKNNIVSAFQGGGAVVAMTGDGVNDAPALKAADIGIAMGSGSDVAKESADMVLLDDNFATIVSAVEEGRVIFDNIRKVLAYLFSTNVGEVTILVMALLFGLPLPLLPLQILWINLVTDGTADLALAFEPGDRDIMKRSPIARDESLLPRRLIWQMMWTAGVMTLIAFGLFLYELESGASIERVRTVVFSFISLASVVNVFSYRSLGRSMFKMGVGQNWWIWGSVLLSFVLQIIAVSVPFMQSVFGTVSLTVKDWVIVVVLSIITLLFVDLRKSVIGGPDGRAYTT